MSNRRTNTVTTVRRVKRVVRLVPVTKQVITCERPYVLFGRSIRDARHEMGWTQLELSEKMGLSRGSIANIEVGRQRVLLTDLTDFAKVLKLDARELFEKTLA